MEFDELKGLVERYIPIYLKSKGVKVKITSPGSNHIKLKCEFESKAYVVEAYEL